MPELRPAPLWAGRTLALLGILLVSLNLRTAAVSFSPIIDQIGQDIRLDGIGIGIIGAIPAVAFSLSALFGAAAAKKVGLERLLVLAIVAMVLGHLLRAASGSYVVFLATTVISLLAAGIGNVLLPPLVKRYFPDRIGLITAMYALLLSVSSALPAAFAAPIADAAGWRASIGVWALLAALSFFPWAILLFQSRRRPSATGDEAPELPSASPALAGKVWHSRMAWSLAIVFALSSAHFYTAAAWFPQLMVDIAGLNHIESGGVLAVYSLVGVPMALLVPVLAVRMKNISWLVLAGIASFILGYVGLMLAPAAAPVLWAAIIGLGNLVFPVSLVLINLRARGEHGSVALSGFVQGVGYAIAAACPLVVGILHDVSGGWFVPMLLMLLISLACVFPAISLRKHKFIEDEVA